MSMDVSACDARKTLIVACRDKASSSYSPSSYSSKQCTCVTDGMTGASSNRQGGYDGVGEGPTFNEVHHSLLPCPPDHVPFTGTGRDLSKPDEATTVYGTVVGDSLVSEGRGQDGVLRIFEKGIYLAPEDKRYRRACMRDTMKVPSLAAKCCATGNLVLKEEGGAVCGSVLANEQSLDCGKALFETGFCNVPSNFETYPRCRSWCRYIQANGKTRQERSACDDAAKAYCKTRPSSPDCKCLSSNPDPSSSLSKIMSKSNSPKQCWWSPCFDGDAVLTSSLVFRSTCPTSLVVCEEKNVSIDCKQTSSSMCKRIKDQIGACPKPSSFAR